MKLLIKGPHGIGKTRIANLIDIGSDDVFVIDDYVGDAEDKASMDRHLTGHIVATTSDPDVDERRFDVVLIARKPEPVVPRFERWLALRSEPFTMQEGIDAGLMSMVGRNARHAALGARLEAMGCTRSRVKRGEQRLVVWNPPHGLPFYMLAMDRAINESPPGTQWVEGIIGEGANADALVEVMRQRGMHAEKSVFGDAFVVKVRLT